jgi:HAD superfamily hydrolase (TIGR01484 family)
MATDYDGTLAHHGTVSAKTLAAIHRLRASGKKLVLVTGRRLEELKQVFPDIGFAISSWRKMARCFIGRRLGG